jgi:hypothetical protein
MARHSSHVGRSDCSSVLQHLLRQAPSVGGRYLLQRPYLQLRARDRLSLGHDTDQAKRFCGVHAVH